MTTIPTLASKDVSISQLEEKNRIEKANAKVVTDFYNLAFQQRQPRQAALSYFGENYVQHNPLVADGAEPFYTFFEGFFTQFPDARSTVHRVMADGDMVILHLNLQPTSDEPGSAVVDIFRVENGKIVEHWDVVQDVPAQTANGHTMFDSVKSN
jgi:predicted SnoaL-like aldol condensation-catalyzing enzyme